MIIPTPKLRIWMTRENFESMSRRRLLRKMASLGVSGGALQFLTGETVAKLTEDPEKNVPRLKGIRHENPSAFTSPPYPKSPKWVPEFYTIPRQKWVEVESARKAEEKIHNIVSEKEITNVVPGISTVDSVKSIVVKYQKRKYCENCKNGEDQYDVPNLSYEEVEQILPTTVSAEVTYNNKTVEKNFPVILEEETISRQMPACDDTYYYQCSYRPVPGGCGLGGEGGGVMATPIYDKDTGNYQLLTCGHCIEDDRDGDGEVEVDQPAGGSQIGVAHDTKTASENSEFDAGVVIRDSGIDYKYDLALDYKDDTYRDWIIIGQLSWSTILDHEGDTSYDLELQGAASGLNSGYIKGTTEFPDGDKTFRIDVDSEKGDSGGPHFYREPYDYGTEYDYQVYIAGIHGWGNDDPVYAKATAMDRVEERFNVRV